MTEEIRPYRNRKPRWRAARRQAMRETGTRPASKQWIMCVEPKVLAIPDWILERQVRGLGEQQGRVWLWPADAKTMISMDRAAGGKSAVQRVEFRHCEMCARPMLADEAVARRLKDESGPGGRRLPCGDNCARDRESRVWKRLTPYYRTRREVA